MLIEGTWRANLEKSRRHENHQFQNATLRFEVAGDDVLLNFGGVNAAGEQESGTRKFHADGKEYPVAEAPGVVEVARWAGEDALETLAKMDGRVVGQSTYEVSGDGKELTARVKGVDASGAEFEQVIVFDRE